jgi:hypothetical protein
MGCGTSNTVSERGDSDTGNAVSESSNSDNGNTVSESTKSVSSASATNEKTVASEKKRPVSATLTTGHATPRIYDVSFEYNDDGTYVARMERLNPDTSPTFSFSTRTQGIYYYYFSNNGCVYKDEYRDLDGKLIDVQYYVNYTAIAGGDPIGFALYTDQIIREFHDNYAKPSYDTSGMISNDEVITEKDEYAVQMYKPTQSISQAKDVSVSRDSNGRIIETSDGAYCTRYSYSGDMITMKGYTILKDAEYCNLVITVELNENGSISKASHYAGEKSIVDYYYTYDENGFLTEVTKHNNDGIEFAEVKIEYVY